MEEFVRETVARELALRELIESVIFLNLSAMPASEQESIFAFLRTPKRNLQREGSLPDFEAEVWADITVRKQQEIDASVARIEELIRVARSRVNGPPK